jgi:signal transduction histidine kinase
LSKKENNESSITDAYLKLGRFHDQYGELDSAIYYYQKLKGAYKKTGLDKAVAETCLELNGLYGAKAAYAESLEQVYEALELYEILGNQKGIAFCYTQICDLLYYENKYVESADYCDKAIAIQQEIDAKEDLGISLRYKASSQLFIEGALEDALVTIDKAIDLYREMGETGVPLLASLNGRGNILKYMERYDEAVEDYKYIYEKTLELGLDRYIVPSIANVGHVYIMQERYKEALPYILRAIELMEERGYTKNLWENYSHACMIYNELGDFEKAYEYSKLEALEREKYLNSIIDRLESEALIKYETAKKDEMIDRQEDTIAWQKRTQILYISIAILLIASLLGMIRSRRKIRKKQKEIEQSRKELQKSLENLKATQAQLIHAEKMASLGELTAGIAHEIQNPLNFVNNFSEVSVDLVGEMNEELESGNTEEVTAIAADLKQNLEKINHHGQRASSIVKGMLEHSRAGDGHKEPTDINALADEYFRLAYHGLRAKDKSFNADFKSDFDEGLPIIDLVPQDVGRVLLNLINNAFYAVHQKTLSGLDSQGTYKPLVTITTKNLGDKIEISVEDNGNGIPESVKEKIFQPFFTTKPTGQGTGLGLSMSYDIITKGHGGTIKVNSKPGKGTEFIIQLPV